MNQKRFCWTCSKALPEIGFTVVNGLAYCPNHLQEARTQAIGPIQASRLTSMSFGNEDPHAGQPLSMRMKVRTQPIQQNPPNPRLMKPFQVDDIVMVGCGPSFGRRAKITSVQGCTYGVMVEGAVPGECASKGIFQRSELTEMPAKVRTQPSAEEYGEPPM